MSSLDFLQEVNVYGVPVPGMESLPDFKYPVPLWEVVIATGDTFGVQRGLRVMANCTAGEQSWHR